MIQCPHCGNTEGITVNEAFFLDWFADAAGRPTGELSTRLDEHEPPEEWCMYCWECGGRFDHPAHPGIAAITDAAAAVRALIYAHRQSGSRFRITCQHGERETLWYIADTSRPEGEQPAIIGPTYRCLASAESGLMALREGETSEIVADAMSAMRGAIRAMLDRRPAP